MKKTRKKYDRAFKERAVLINKLREERNNLSELACDWAYTWLNYINGTKKQKSLERGVSPEMEI